MIYVTNDPEYGYVDEDHVERIQGALWAVDEDGVPVMLAFPAPCSVCEGPIPEDANFPLCRTHDRTARATAEAFPEGPERFGRRRRVEL